MDINSITAYQAELKTAIQGVTQQISTDQAYHEKENEERKKLEGLE